MSLWECSFGDQALPKPFAVSSAYVCAGRDAHDSNPQSWTSQPPIRGGLPEILNFESVVVNSTSTQISTFLGSP